MADERDDAEKSEEPTTQRREDFRKQGQVAQSRELATVFSLFGSALIMWLMGKYFLQQTLDMFNVTFRDFLVTAGRSGDYKEVAKFCVERGLFIMAPFLLAIGVLGFASSVLQVGFIFSTEVVDPNLDKVDPIQGFFRIFSLRSLVEGLKSLAKVGLVSFIVFLIVKSEFKHAPAMMNMETMQMVRYLCTVSIKIIFWVGVFMAAIATLDYGFQRWDLEKKMRMTKQELKEEVRTREGDPQIKARIRRLQRETASKRMMESVPKADVIVTNPTHIAVALMYSDNLPAPQVVAKGAGVVAEKIKELAREHKIPIVENKPLARTIFKTIKIGQVIPRELYNAVAEVLAYVFRIRKKVRR